MPAQSTPATRYRWSICSLLFFATTINYLDRQVLSPDMEGFHRTGVSLDELRLRHDHPRCFSIFYAFGMLMAGRFID